MSNSKILFLMSGSIAGFKACQVISRLVQLGHEVQVAATPSTFQFVGPATLEGLTGRKPLSDLWEPGRAMDHIHLTKWADFAVLCPASAHTLARLSSGFADELVSALTLAWPPEKKFFIFPAMNRLMLAAGPTQDHLARLRERGFLVAGTAQGNLACGDEGEGRLLEPEEILKTIFAEPKGRVLITGGATREPIDGIRFISNVSTGQTAARLCDEMTLRGWQVTYLHGESAAQPARAADKIQFSDFKDLDHQLRARLGELEFHAVIHCAAVSDYSVENARVGEKLPTGENLTLQLRSNFKILPRLKEYSRRKDIRVIGFKLTLNRTTIETAEIGHGLLSENVDAVVANEWSAVNSDRSRHPGRLLTKDKAQAFETLATLADLIDENIGGSHDPLS